MKSILLLSLVFCINFTFAQNNEFGSKFEFDTKLEKDEKIVIKDNYNHYLFSVISDRSMTNKLIMRKFDQKNMLVDTYKFSFGSDDRSTYSNYLASYEVGNDKVIAFTENYSGKLKKKEIFKHIFDKKTSKFETTLLATYPIESVSKSGDTYVSRSDNGSFIALNYVPRKEKDAPETNSIMMMNANGELLWKKDVEADPAFSSPDITVTNTGKIVLLRHPKSWKVGNKLMMITADAQEEKKFDEELIVSKVHSVTIGEQDYLVGIYYSHKKVGIRTGDYDKLFFYDLNAGRILKTNKITGYSEIKDIAEVVFRGVYFQDDEILLFTEAKAKIPVVNPDGTRGVNPVWDLKYNNVKPCIIVLNKDGSLKSQTDLYNQTHYNNDNFFKSFGLQQIKGSFYIDYCYYSGYSVYGKIAKLDMANSYQPSVVHDFSQSLGSNRLVSQLIAYLPDSKKTIFTVMASETEMQFVNVYNVGY